MLFTAVTPLSQLLPDAALVERIAALGDRSALAELDRRHGMTLYAIAYTLLLDSEASDSAVAVAMREVWRQAASFDVRGGTVAGWLAELTRGATRARLRRQAPMLPRGSARRAPVSVTPLSARRVAAASRPPRRRPLRLARVLLARAVRFAAAVVVPAVFLRWTRA